MGITKSIALVAALSFSACDRLATEPDGPMTGTWKYTAIETFKTRPSSADTTATCVVETTLTIRQEGPELHGVSAEAPSRCTARSGTVVVAAPNFPAASVRGEVEGGRVHFSTAGSYHSFGELAPDRIEGYLEWYDGSSEGVIRPYRDGTFTLERVSHDGFTGARN